MTRIIFSLPERMVQYARRKIFISEVLMDLDVYFDVLAPDDIRIHGTRIGIESILYEYIHRGQSPEAIAERFHSARHNQS